MTFGTSLFKRYWMSRQGSPEPGEVELPIPYYQMSGLWARGNKQAMDTGLLTDPTDEWIVVVGKSNLNSSGHICGGSYSKTDSNMGIYSGGGNGGNRFTFSFGNAVGGSKELEVLDCPAGEPHELRMKQSTGEVWIDGVLKGQIEVTDTLAHPTNLMLFGQKRGSSIYSSFDNGFIHSFKIIRNGTLIRDFVPAAVGDKLINSSEHGMVDMEAVRRGTGQVFYPYGGGFVWSYDTRLTVEATSEQLTYTVYLRYPYTNSGIHMGSKIDWGDGTIDSVDGVEHPSHTYAEPGEYQVHFMINYQNGRLSVTNETNNANAKMIKSLDSYSGQQALPDNFLRYASNVDVAASVLKDIRYIGDCSLNECASLTLPVLPKNLLLVEGGAFRGCPDLAFTSLPSNMRYIGSYAFASTKLTIKSIPREVTYIGSSAFEFCGDMPLASMGDKVVTLGWYAFRDCVKATIDHLSPLITSLGRNTFSNCPLIAISELPPNLTGTIGQYALEGCTNITVSSIPEGVTATDSSAFSRCEKIPSMVIPASMDNLGYHTFYGCTSMRYAIFKGKPSTVYNNIFESCPALTDIYVPWAEGAVANAPWGATNATIHYNHQVS